MKLNDPINVEISVHEYDHDHFQRMTAIITI